MYLCCQGSLARQRWRDIDERKVFTPLVPYKVQPDQYGSFVYSVTLGVNLALPKPNAPRTKRFEAIIDSGASRCLFHASIAAYLGLDLKAGIPEYCNGISGRQETWLHDVFLYMPGGAVTIKAGFAEALPVSWIAWDERVLRAFCGQFRSGKTGM